MKFELYRRRKEIYIMLTDNNLCLEYTTVNGGVYHTNSEPYSLNNQRGILKYLNYEKQEIKEIEI